MCVAAGVRTVALLERCSFLPPDPRALELDWSMSIQDGHHRCRRTVPLHLGGLKF